jgi:hypothetical protein
MSMVPAWPAPPAAADVLLFMNEPNAHRRWRRRRGKRRALEQRWAQVAAEIEHSEPHQASLRQVLKLGDDFQRSLSQPQRASWLALEDALLEHTERSHRAYFLAGVEVGQRVPSPGKASRTGSRSTGSRSTGSRDFVRRPLERSEALSMLAQLLVELVERARR